VPNWYWGQVLTRHLKTPGTRLVPVFKGLYGHPQAPSIMKLYIWHLGQVPFKHLKTPGPRELPAFKVLYRPPGAPGIKQVAASGAK